MLEATRPVSPEAAFESRSSAREPRSSATGPQSSATGPRSSATGARSAATGSRSSRHKRHKFRRSGIVLPAVFIAVLLVAVVAIAAKVMSPNGSGASSLAEQIDTLPGSHAVALLEKERQTIIIMNAAANTLAIASKPATVSPSQVLASQSAAADSSSSSTGITSIPAPPPDPGTAQEIGYDLLPAYGFSQKTQWGCLLNLWNRESGWIYDAENASGAYGIPQALPGDKMASAGPDWETNPTTQIKWGLTYITQVYGTPCGAWDHEVNYGWY
jgi:hypothetical protein